MTVKRPYRRSSLGVWFRNTVEFRLGIFMALCLFLGSTTREISLYKPPLLILSVLYIAWSLCRINRDSLIWQLKIPLLFLAVFIGINLLYLVPLPPSVWSQIPGREMSMQGFEALGLSMPWMPISLSPEKSLFSMLGFLPPIAVMFGIGTANAAELKNAFWAIIFLSIITVLLGLLQAVTLNADLSLYDGAAANRPAGFFSNINHNASFLLMTLPLSIGMLFKSILRKKWGKPANIAICISAIAAFAAGIGVLMSFSVAGYLILMVLLLSCLYICAPKTKFAIRVQTGLGVILIGGVVIDFFLGGFFLEFLAEFNSNGTEKRKFIYQNSLHSIKAYFPFGSGIGSFYDASRPFMLVKETISLHPHNEILETVHSIGVFGIGMIGGFAVWWGRIIYICFKPNAPAATLVRCAVLSTLSVIVHSMVSFPLHTISISCLFVFLVSYITIQWKI